MNSAEARYFVGACAIALGFLFPSCGSDPSSQGPGPSPDGGLTETDANLDAVAPLDGLSPPSQPDSGVDVQGALIERFGTPIASRVVRIRAAGESQPVEVMTDAAGRFETKNIRVPYDLAVQAEVATGWYVYLGLSNAAPKVTLLGERAKSPGPTRTATVQYRVQLPPTCATRTCAVDVFNGTPVRRYFSRSFSASAGATVAVSSDSVQWAGTASISDMYSAVVQTSDGVYYGAPASWTVQEGQTVVVSIDATAAVATQPRTIRIDRTRLPLAWADPEVRGNAILPANGFVTLAAASSRVLEFGAPTSISGALYGFSVSGSAPDPADGSIRAGSGGVPLSTLAVDVPLFPPPTLAPFGSGQPSVSTTPKLDLVDLADPATYLCAYSSPDADRPLFVSVYTTERNCPLDRLRRLNIRLREGTLTVQVVASRPARPIDEWLGLPPAGPYLSDGVSAPNPVDFTP